MIIKVHSLSALKLWRINYGHCRNWNGNIVLGSLNSKTFGIRTRSGCWDPLRLYSFHWEKFI